MSLESEFYDAILQQALDALDGDDPAVIEQVVWEVVDNLRAELLMQGQRVIDDLRAAGGEQKGAGE